MGDSPPGGLPDGAASAADVAELRAEIAALARAFAAAQPEAAGAAGDGGGSGTPVQPATAAAAGGPPAADSSPPRRTAQDTGRAATQPNPAAGGALWEAGRENNDSLVFSNVTDDDSESGPVYRSGGRGEDEYAGHPDGLDDPAIPAPDDVLVAFKMPKRIRRPDELPVPFTPADVEHVANFPKSDQVYEEANATYVAATGAQDLANAAASLYHQRDSLTEGTLEARLAWLAVATRVHYRIIAARYDYLVASKNEPGLAELYLATDAVPRNRGRGPGWQRFLNAVAVDEARVFTKRAAEARLNAPRRRQKRRPGGGPGGGGGGGGGGRCRRRRGRRHRLHHQQERCRRRGRRRQPLLLRRRQPLLLRRPLRRSRRPRPPSRSRLWWCRLARQRYVRQRWCPQLPSPSRPGRGHRPRRRAPAPHSSSRR